MTTTIESLINEEYQSNTDSDTDSECENLLEIVMDLSRSVDKRLNAFEEYYNQVGDNAMEILSTLSGMYQISGSKLIEQFLYRICINGKISIFLKLEAAKSLLDYKEVEKYTNNDDDKDYRIAYEKEVNQRNTERQIIGYKALDYVCRNLNSMATPCRIEAIFKLMGSTEFQKNADTYFCDFVRDDNIDCEFRYKTILSLEKIGADLMKEEIGKFFIDKEFVEYMYNSLKSVISKLFPNIKPNPKNQKFWNKVIFQLSYDDIHSIYSEKFPEKLCQVDLFIRNSQLAFLFHKSNMTYYRTLSGQYLLQKCELTENKRLEVESELLKFAKDTELDYNRRADAADVLIRLGSDNMKQYGRIVIMELGRVNGNIRTVFDNAQNVHTEEVEESVAQALEFFSTLPLYEVNNRQIDFDYVNEKIEKMLKEEKESFRTNEEGAEKCDHCESLISLIKDMVKSENNKFCSNKCFNFYSRDVKIRVALNRIFMDRALYSKFNSTLVNILLKVYTYIITHEEESVKQQMYKRLLEELEEMSGTCSTGFASRLINVISGFGQFNIRISYEDQIIANFIGRLNAAARHITNKESIFRTKKLNDVVQLWLNKTENKDIRDNIEEKLNPDKKLEKRPNIVDIIKEFFSKNREEKIDKCVEDFSESVLNEMISNNYNYFARQNFSLFFRSYVSIIREELANEFKDIIDSSLFDLYFRKAIMHYEGFN